MSSSSTWAEMRSCAWQDSQKTRRVGGDELADLAVALNHRAIVRRHQGHESGLGSACATAASAICRVGDGTVIDLARDGVLLHQPCVALQVDPGEVGLRLELGDVAGQVLGFQPGQHLPLAHVVVLVAEQAPPAGRRRAAPPAASCWLPPCRWHKPP